MSLLRQAIAQASLMYQAFSVRVGRTFVASAVQQQKKLSKPYHLCDLQEKLAYHKAIIKDANERIIKQLKLLESDPNHASVKSRMIYWKRRLETAKEHVKNIEERLPRSGAKKK